MTEPNFANVSIPGPHGPIPGYIATPKTPGPWPGVVVIHDAIGFGSAVRNHADWLAEEGYLAVAPNLFHWDKKMACLKSSFRAVRERKGRQFEEIEAARQFLAAQPGHTGKTGIIGFCMGGAYVLLLAPNADDYHAASINYGRIPEDAGEILKGACPVIASYGGNDRSIKNGGERIEKALTEAGVVHDVKEYPGAGHMFMDKYDKGELPRSLTALEKIFGMGYREGAAEDAKRRIEAFFEEHLKGQAAPTS